MRVSKGIIRAYDAASHKADVLLVGSLSRVALGVPVSYQVAPEQVAVDTVCGVVFFGEGDRGMVVCTVGDEPAVPLGAGGFGPAMDSYDMLRGWREEFFGKQIDARYTTYSVGSGSQSLVTFHGGVYRLRTTASGSEESLWLGAAGSAYSSLESLGKGWVMVGLLQHQHCLTAGGQQTMMGVARDTNYNEYIWCGVNYARSSTNWLVVTNDGVAVSQSNSGVAFDQDWHYHMLHVHDQEVDYYIDSELVVDGHSSNVSTSKMTPILRNYNGTNTDRHLRVNFWTIIPRN
ncbi:MAG: hypothetical protein GTN93_21825 [Anaerolineae bacterium]|nr:hypothetical protein [Anaerolineae bacterium]NIQ80681.1 hypothetical protein [Anaerolineae bacterium]